MPRSILVVDDEPSIRKVLAAQLKRVGYGVTAAANGAEAVSLLSERPFDLVISDLQMPGIDGMALLAHCRASLPALPVILITAHGTVDTAVEAIKLGAHDYITKPFDQHELLAIITKALRTGEARSTQIHADAEGRFAIIGRTSAMRRIYTRIEKVADKPTTVLITGESGTGKELVAQALHDNSSRTNQAFIQVNCGAIPENLFESELFGHEKGSFTGAATSKPGRFELADGGTLFLDEIGELPLSMQVKLLRVIQDGTFDRVGGIRSRTVDVRLVAATNRDLKTEVKEGRFREDLFYRLSVIPIELPPLRDRIDDIPLLAKHFICGFNPRLGTEVEGVTPEAITAMKAYGWPGNIRELENLMERSMLLADPGARMLGPADLSGLGEPQEDAEDAQGPDGPPGALQGLGLKEYVRAHTERLERAHIQRALSDSSGNVTHAARALGISRKSLQIKMRMYRLRDDEPGTGTN
ncbi:MAG: two-component system response regulator AtoC [Myxococcota bacterium]|jgi:two-component system response regulator AtoC